MQFFVSLPPAVSVQDRLGLRLTPPFSMSRTLTAGYSRYQGRDSGDCPVLPVRVVYCIASHNQIR